MVAGEIIARGFVEKGILRRGSFFRPESRVNVQSGCLFNSTALSSRNSKRSICLSDSLADGPYPFHSSGLGLRLDQDGLVFLQILFDHAFAR